MHQEFDPRDLEPSLPKREERPVRSKLAPILIAGVALAGFGGVVWYAYDQGIRQSGPTGATPLIKADNSPTKMRPDQPGGMDVPHQDKLVLNNLAENKSGTPAIERLLPPPESPLPRPAPTAQAPNMTPAAPPPISANPGLPPKIGPAPATPLAAALPAPTPVAPAPAATAAAPPTPIAAPRDAVQSSGSSGAPSSSGGTQVAAAPGAAPKPAEKPPVKPAPTPAAAPSATGGATGGFKVQLVSVKAEGETKNEWARLQKTYPQLASLKMSVTRVDLGDKGIWYRIFAGPLSDAGSAGELCSALKAKGQGCVVAKP